MRAVKFSTNSYTNDTHFYVDDEEYDNVIKYKWLYHKCFGTKYYVIRGATKQEQIEGTSSIIYLHRFILGLNKGDNKVVDHINDPKTGYSYIHNIKINLRITNSGGNAKNAEKRKDNISGYKGVCFFRASKKWKAQIRIKNKRLHLGLFSDVIEAAIAYDKAAIKYFGEFARTNFPKSNYTGVTNGKSN